MTITKAASFSAMSAVLIVAGAMLTLALMPPPQKAEAVSPSTMMVAAQTVGLANSAQEWAIVEKGYVLVVRVNPNGTATYRRVPLAKPEGDVRPPINPPIADLTERGEAVRVEADAVDHPASDATAAGMAAMTREIVKLSGEDQPLDTRRKMELAIKTGFDAVIDRAAPPSAKESWKKTRQVIGDQWSALVQQGEGQDGDLGEYKKLLGEVADGLDASVDDRSAFDILFILELIKMILALISSLGGTGL